MQDNGGGMPHDQIPDMLGRVLSGTKYGVGQTRGKFGLGAKMALIWSKMTTGMPFEIRSAQPGSSFQSRYQLDIDIHKNAPNVHVAEVLPPFRQQFVCHCGASLAARRAVPQHKHGQLVVAW